MMTWLASLRDRPIAESERSAAMMIVTVLLIAATILLTLFRPGKQSQRTTERTLTTIVHSTTAPTQSKTDPAPLTPTIAGAANTFLAGYLSYLYGHAPASHIKGATIALLHSLQTHPPRVSPAMRARIPRVLALRSTPAPLGTHGVSVLVNDGGLIDYAIGLMLAPEHGRLLVTALEGA